MLFYLIFVEFAAVIVDISKRVIRKSVFHRYVKPKNMLSKEAITFLGISVEKCNRASCLSTCLKEFQSFLKKRKLVIGQNTLLATWSLADERMIRQELDAKRLPEPTWLKNSIFFDIAATFKVWLVFFLVFLSYW